MLSLNQHLIGLQQSATIALADKARRLQADGMDIVSMTAGDPDFDTPQPIIEAATQALQSGKTHYVDSKGLPALRQAIVAHIEKETGVQYDPDTEIQITHGGTHAYHCALQSILNVDDEVLIADPTWPTHYNMIQNLRGKPVRVVGLPENGFLPTVSAWEEAITERTIALVINSPSNPTGMMATRDYLASVYTLAKKHDLYVISDEVYDHITYDDYQHVSSVSIENAKERTLLINSFSKTYAMTGWRIGYLVAPSEIISQAQKASQNSITCVAPFIQQGAVCALTSPDVANEAQRMVDTYTKRRALVKEIWEEHQDSGTQLRLPQGTFYVFLDISNVGLSSEQFCAKLLQEAGVAVIPGTAYGAHGEGFIRMTTAIAESGIERGFLALLAWAKQARQI